MDKLFNEYSNKLLALLTQYPDGVTIEDIFHTQLYLDCILNICRSDYETLHSEYSNTMYLHMKKLCTERDTLEELSTIRPSKKYVKWVQVVGLASKKIDENIKGTLPNVPEIEMCGKWE